MVSVCTKTLIFSTQRATHTQTHTSTHTDIDTDTDKTLLQAINKTKINNTNQSVAPKEHFQLHSVKADWVL